MNYEVTDEQLNEILARCNASSPGPWKSYVEERDHESGSDFIMTAGENDIELTGDLRHFDQDFIANAKQDIPLLVNEIRRLKSLLAGTK